MVHAFNIPKAPETVPTAALALLEIPQTYYLPSSHIFIEGLLAWFQFSGHNHMAQCSHNDIFFSLKTESMLQGHTNADIDRGVILTFNV